MTETVACEAPSILSAFESENAGLHLDAAQRIMELARASQLSAAELAGPWLENVECLMSQDLRFYEAMFMGRDPESGEQLDDTDRWVLRHEGQIRSEAKANLRELVRSLPEKFEMCEVGSFIGRGSTRAFVEAIRDFDKDAAMYCVDLWSRHVLLKMFAANIHQFAAEDFVTPIQKSSTEASLDFEDEHFDLVYIDGAHDYQSVMSDLCSWYPKVKPGGVIAGNDCEGRLDQCVLQHVLERCHLDADPQLFVYEGENRLEVGGHPGVIRAVHEFFRGQASVGTFDEKQWCFVKK